MLPGMLPHYKATFIDRHTQNPAQKWIGTKGSRALIEYIHQTYVRPGIRLPGCPGVYHMKIAIIVKTIPMAQGKAPVLIAPLQPPAPLAIAQGRAIFLLLP